MEEKHLMFERTPKQKLALDAANRADTLPLASVPALEAIRYDRLAKEAQAEERKQQKAARYIAERSLSNPPDWLKRAKSPRRLPVALTGWETAARYDERMLIVKHLAAMEADYDRALQRLDQQRANECLTHIAGLHTQLQELVDRPEKLVTDGRNF